MQLNTSALTIKDRWGRILNEATCLGCGQTYSRMPFFMDGPNCSDVFFDDRCSTCSYEEMKRLPRRIFKAFQISRLSPQEASDLTGIEPGWFESSAKADKAFFGFEDCFIFNEDCGKVTAKLMAAARKRWEREPEHAPKVVSFVDFQNRGKA